MKRNFGIGHANARSFVLGEMTSSKATRCTDNKDYVGRTVHVPSQVRRETNARFKGVVKTDKLMILFAPNTAASRYDGYICDGDAKNPY